MMFVEKTATKLRRLLKNGKTKTIKAIETASVIINPAKGCKIIYQESN